MHVKLDAVSGPVPGPAIRENHQPRCATITLRHPVAAWAAQLRPAAETTRGGPNGPQPDLASRARPVDSGGDRRGRPHGKREAPQKVDELREHLREIGVEVTAVATPVAKRPWRQKPAGTLTIVGGNVESLDVIGVAGQYGVSYYAEYLVRTSGFVGTPGKTRMIWKRTSFLRGEITGIKWKGDARLAARLNYDDGLKDRLLQVGPGGLKGGLIILPETKHGYARIRTGYSLPERAALDIIQAVAGHVRAEW